MNIKKILSSKLFKIVAASTLAIVVLFIAYTLILSVRGAKGGPPVYQLVQTKREFPILVNINDTYLGDYLMQNGGYPTYLDKYYELFLKPGSVILDIGAEYGYHTVLFARKAGKFSTIYSIEPRSDNAKIAKLNMNLNKIDNIIMFNKTLYSQNGVHYLKSLPSSSAWNLIVAKNAPKQDAKKTIKPVKTHQLDNLARNVFGVNLMRINGHGTEIEIIKGAKSIIEKSPNLGIFLYWNKKAISSYGNPEETIRQLSDIGFNFWFVNESGILKLISAAELLNLSSGDVIITKKPMEQQ